MRAPTLPFSGSLAEAKRKVLEGREAGVECPCCGQFAKTYRRRLYAGIAAWLCQLVARYRIEPRWYSTSERWSLLTNSGRGDAAKLSYWGLIVPKRHKADARKRTSGLWRPTERGFAFVDGRERVPSHVYVYDARVVGFSEETVSIEEALGDSFDYRELMGAPRAR